MPSGSIATLTADGRLFTIDPASGDRTTVARGLPVCFLGTPYPRSGGLTVGFDNSFYVSADVENAIYRISAEVN